MILSKIVEDTPCKFKDRPDNLNHLLNDFVIK